jgi:putative FmdB family regulatory protein
MPIYEYDCPKCGRFEVIQKLSASPLRTHAECGSRVQKALSAGSFTVKGPSGPSCERASGSSPACASCPSARG